LAPVSDFRENVSIWLASLGMVFRISSADPYPFAVIEIMEGGISILQLKLIDLKTWAELPAGAQDTLILSLRNDKDLQADKNEVVIWQDLWESRQGIVKSRVAALLGISQRIPARVTQVRRIDKQTATDFLEASHLQGAVSSRIRYGLFLPERYYRLLSAAFLPVLPPTELLVAVVTFSHPRTFLRDGNPHKSFEMIRFSNLIQSTVVGGLAKLLMAFSSDFHPDDIMTYADLEWSGGTSYSKLGFTAVSETSPIRFWLDPITMCRYSEKQAASLNLEECVSVYNLGSRKFVKIIV
jgi:hypothetical protein